MHLAGHLSMSLKRCLQEVDSRELTKWIAYDRLHPLDHARRGEVSAGIIAALLSVTGKRASDFMSDYAAEWRDKLFPPEPSDGQLVADKIDALFGSPKFQLLGGSK